MWTKNALYAQLQELARDMECAKDWYEEWDLKNQEWELQTEFILPKILHSPFLLTIFALYETTVTEIANLLQPKQNTKVSLAAHGSFPTEAKRFFRKDIQLRLYSSNQNWERITQLYTLRNAIIHANSRFDMMSDNLKEGACKLLDVKGVYKCYGYILVNRAFLQETFNIVREELVGLASRYKERSSEFERRRPKEI